MLDDVFVLVQIVPNAQNVHLANVNIPHDKRALGKDLRPRTILKLLGIVPVEPLPITGRIVPPVTSNARSLDAFWRVDATMGT